MRRPSRRRVLTGLTTAGVAAAAGCIGLGDSTDEEAPGSDETPSGDETPDGDDESGKTSLPGAVQTTLSYVYPPSTQASILRVGEPGRDSTVYAAPSQYSVTGDSTVEYTARIRGVSSGDEPEDSTDTGVVLAGSIDIEKGETVEKIGSDRGFDRYERRNDDDRPVHFVTNGDVLLGGSKSWVDRTLDSEESGAETLAEANPEVLTLLEQCGTTDYSATVVHGESFIESEVNGDEFQFTTAPAALALGADRDEETVSIVLAMWYEEQVGETEREEFGTAAESAFGLGLADVDPEVRADGHLLVSDTTRPYTPPEERPEVPQFPTFAGYDQEEDVVLFEFDDGDSLPVENFEIEIEGEVYEGEWARGQDEIGAGDRIAVDADAIEPGDSLTISYSAESYTTGGGTTVLNRLPFRATYEPGESRATVEYVDGPPLDGSRVTLDPVDAAAISPWDGDLTAGDTTTLSDVSIETHERIEIRYERSDGEEVRLGFTGVAPPGRFELEYAPEQRELTVTYPDLDDEVDEEDRYRGRDPDQDPAPTAAYEVRVDGEPVATQLTAVGETIAPGESVTVADVPVGVSASVVWTGPDGETYTMDEIEVTRPAVTFEFAYDDGSVMITHAEGMEIDAADLSVRLLGEEERTVEWDGDGTVSVGDETVVEDVDDAQVVLVQFRGAVIADKPIPEIRDED